LVCRKCSFTYLQGPVLGICLGIGREAGCVPAIVTWELALQIRGGLCREGSQELGAVGAIPVVGALQIKESNTKGGRISRRSAPGGRAKHTKKERGREERDTMVSLDMATGDFSRRALLLVRVLPARAGEGEREREAAMAAAMGQKAKERGDGGGAPASLRRILCAREQQGLGFVSARSWRAEWIWCAESHTNHRALFRISSSSTQTLFFSSSSSSSSSPLFSHNPKTLKP
jgi:hypothetical protein